MANKPILVTVASLAIAGSIAWIVYQMPGRRPSVELDPYRALGEVAAQETGRLLNRNGQVVIVSREMPPGANPVEEAKLKAFVAALKSAGVGVEANERFTLPPAARVFGSNIPRDWFLKLLQTHNKAAFALFAEFPALEPADLEKLKKDGNKIVLISGSPSGAKRLVDEGLVQFAVVPRGETPPDASTKPENTRATFDRYYTILAPGKTGATP
jgi:hypothetical protein